MKIIKLLATIFLVTTLSFVSAQRLDGWLLSPNGREVFNYESDITLIIDRQIISPEFIDVELSKAGEVVWNQRFNGTDIITIPTLNMEPGADYEVSIAENYDPSRNDYYEASSGSFSINSSEKRNWLLTPNGGEYFNGSIIYPTFDRYGSDFPSLTMELYKGTTLVKSRTSTSWNPSISTSGLAKGSDYKLKVFDSDNPNIYDWSDAYFAIDMPFDINEWLITPNGGEIYGVEEGPSEIRINVADYIYRPRGDIIAELYQASYMVEQIRGSRNMWDNYLSFDALSHPSGGDYRIKVYDQRDPEIYDWSDGFFSIGTTANMSNWVIQPMGVNPILLGDDIVVNVDRYVHSESSGLIIELYQGTSLIRQQFGDMILSTASLSPGVDYRIKVIDAQNTEIFGWNDAPFSIEVPINLNAWLLTPNGGEVLQENDDLMVTLNQSVVSPNNVTIEIYKGVNEVARFSSPPDGRIIRIPNQRFAGHYYRIKVTSTTNPLIYDWSDTFFSIGIPENITSWLITPNGGGTYIIGKDILLDIDPLIHDPTLKNSQTMIELYKKDALEDKDRIRNISIQNNKIETRCLTPGDYVLKIYDKNDPEIYDWSDGYFTLIVPPNINQWLVSPNGGDTIHVGDNVTIETDTSIFRARGRFSMYNTNGTPTNISIVWGKVVTNRLVTGTYRLKITSGCGNGDYIYDRSEGTITVDVPTNMSSWLLTPNGGEVFNSGDDIPVAIDQAMSLPTALAIQLYKGNVFIKGLNTASVDGRIISTAGLEPGDNYRIKVIHGEDSNIFDLSDGYFSISDINMNWTQTLVYGENGVEIGGVRTYFDHAGKVLQTQAKDILNNDVFVTAIVRDKQGREALTTLPAPKGRPTFGYAGDFIQSSYGQNYTANNFDVSKYSPNPVYTGNPGTLGWYYSTNNTDEPNTPITGYPYSRTEFYEDGEIKRVASPGDMHRLGAVDNNVMGTFPVINELDDYINKRETILTYTATGINLQGKAIQQVSIDAEGKMAIAITDQEGNGVMSALAGGNVLSVTTPPSGFAADGSDQYKKYFYITNDETSLSWSGSSADVEIKDVWRNTSYTAPTSLNRGLYRVTAGSYRPGFTNYYSNISYNFYNDAGRLKTSVSPNGVEQLKAGVALSKIDKTTYTYNHKGWLLSITEPDAGTTNYLYRRDGKIRFSQNNQQKNNSVSIDSYFSYTNYDNAGRPLESGEYQRFWDDLDPIEFNDATMLTSLEDIGVNNYATSKASWVKSYYDLPVFTNELPTNYQNPTYLMGAVAVTENENSKTWYSYDSEGKVTWVVQKIIKFDGTNDKFFTINYTYNYYGNVTQVAFQKSEALEAFYHHYEYDFNQRLVNVRTSVNGDPEDAEAAYQHASYEYYKHGPLKRTVLGKNLQGLDYTYTIEGWLKSVNNPTADPGEDGIATSTYKDAFGMTLEYYTNDYTNAGQTETPVTGLGNYDEHYNGNIKATTWNKGSFEKPEPAPQTIVLNEYDANQSSVIARNMITLASGFKVEGEEFTAGIDPEAMIQPLNIDRSGAYAYTYDEKYQLEEATFATMQTGTPAFGTKFKETNLAYDANGNMQSLTRTNEAGTTTDNFTYNYNPATTTQQNNQLEDIPDYANYFYNAIGQLTQQTVENVTTFIAYDVTGKVTGVYKDTNHNTPITEFTYDDRGFRISKTTWDIEADTLLYTTWYIRDATGNVMATYDTKEVDDGEVTPVQTELPIYGSGRIGIAFNRTGTTLQYNYELTDHLGNVRSVVTPLKSMAIATMEDEYAQLEEFEFKNIAETRHTESGIFTAESSNMARLNNMPTDGSIANGIGPARILRVQEGDVIKMSVDARYFEKQGMNNGVVGAIASIITSGLGLTPAGETVQAYNALTDLLNAGSLVPPGQEGVPKAYLNYLLLDYNFNHIFDNEDTENQPWVIITTAAATGTEKLLLELTAPVDGYMYIYVANETDDDINVYFDNLTITHTGLQVVEQTDYYPYGMVMRKELPNQGQGIYNPYRHGYQGQFAEKDEETGWNHFELRQYGSRIGRWTATDPYRQYYSPYVGMGNNPVYYTDPDGGFSSWIGAFGAWVASGFNGTIEKAGGARVGEYFIGRQYGLDGEAGIGYQRIFEVDNTNFVGKSYNVIDYGAGFTADFVGGVKDFGEQYITMTYLTNFLDSDKYFHSKANFNATLRGAGGEYAAEKLSNFREIFDQRIKGDSRLSSLEDQEANRYGRERANHYKVHFYGPINYKEAIPKFRTNRLLDEQGY